MTVKVSYGLHMHMWTHMRGVMGREGKRIEFTSNMWALCLTLCTCIFLCVLSLTLNSGFWKKWPIPSSTEDVIEAEKGRLIIVSNTCMHICVYILSQLCLCMHRHVETRGWPRIPLFIEVGSLNQSWVVFDSTGLASQLAQGNLPSPPKSSIIIRRSQLLPGCWGSKPQNQ